MAVVHSTQGRLTPVSEHLRAEPVIVARMAEATFGPEHSVDWRSMAEDYDVIRDHIECVLPGFEDFNARVRTKNGFVLPNRPRHTRSFATDIGRGHGRFTVSPLEYHNPPPGHLVLQTTRSHDQYNTTFYDLDDRYRGISGGRRVILIHPEDLAESRFQAREMVDVISTFQGMDRRADKFRLVDYPTAKGCAAACFPEANALVHKENVARESNTPGFKAMFVRFEPHKGEAATQQSRLVNWNRPQRANHRRNSSYQQMICTFVKRSLTLANVEVFALLKDSKTTRIGAHSSIRRLSRGPAELHHLLRGVRWHRN